MAAGGGLSMPAGAGAEPRPRAGSPPGRGGRGRAGDHARPPARQRDRRGHQPRAVRGVRPPGGRPGPAGRDRDGAGGRFFCAGWDLKAAAAGEDAGADHGPGGFAGLTELHGRAKPIIAAVNGVAAGGGFELALAADLVVAAEHADFRLPETGLGIIPDSGGVLWLPRRLPRPVAVELLLTGRPMTAAEACDRGLVNQAVPADQLMPAARALAAQIIRSAPLAVAAVLEVLDATETGSVPEGFAALRSGRLPRYAAMLASEDAAEGPAAFAARRPAVWKGR